MTGFDSITTEQAEVFCDGGGGALGHPRVFLHIASETGVVVCPYCSRVYMLRGVAELGASHAH